MDSGCCNIFLQHMISESASGELVETGKQIFCIPINNADKICIAFCKHH